MPDCRSCRYFIWIGGTSPKYVEGVCEVTKKRLWGAERRKCRHYRNEASVSLEKWIDKG